MAKTFSETSSRLESQMGRIDYAAFTKLLSEGESAMGVRARYKALKVLWSAIIASPRQ
jgi:hypothetical protein